MPRAVRISIIAAAVPIVLWGWIGVVFAMDHAADGGEVLALVAIGGVELGGLDESEAVAAVKSRSRPPSEPRPSSSRSRVPNSPFSLRTLASISTSRPSSTMH